jgi:hypothetical protein
MPGTLIFMFIPGTFIFMFIPDTFIFMFIPDTFIFMFIPGTFIFMFIPGTFIFVIMTVMDILIIIFVITYPPSVPIHETTPDQVRLQQSTIMPYPKPQSAVATRTSYLINVCPCHLGSRAFHPSIQDGFAHSWSDHGRLRGTKSNKIVRAWTWSSISTEKFGMTSPKKRTSAECQLRRNGNESTFRRYIGISNEIPAQKKRSTNNTIL